MADETRRAVTAIGHVVIGPAEAKARALRRKSTVDEGTWADDDRRIR